MAHIVTIYALLPVGPDYAPMGRVTRQAVSTAHARELCHVEMGRIEASMNRSSFQFAVFFGKLEKMGSGPPTQ